MFHNFILANHCYPSTTISYFITVSTAENMTMTTFVNTSMRKNEQPLSCENNMQSLYFNWVLMIQTCFIKIL